MNQRVPLLFPFILALFATAFASVFLPYTRLHTFAPCLALIYARCSRASSLWLSSLCGLIVDLLSVEFHFGLHALSFAAATLFLYEQKRHFYDDKPLALALFTFQLSLFLTCVHSIFAFLSHTSFAFSPKLIAIDFFALPLCDALYAFLWFSCSMALFLYVRRIGWSKWITRLFCKPSPSEE